MTALQRSVLFAPGVPPPLSWLSALIAACVASAWALALGWPRRPAAPLYRPVAWLLSWTIASDLTRATLQACVTSPARAALGPEPPYGWPAVVAYHADEALHVAGPVALVAAALAVFVRRRPWRWVVGAWAALAAGSGLAYPALRLGPRDVAHAVLSTAALAGVSAAAWYSLQRRRDVWRAEHLAVMVLAGMELGVALSTLWWSDPGAHWDIARRVQQGGYSLLLAAQLWHTSRRR